MIVMGGIIGSGIFVTPSVVARLLHSTAGLLAAWIFGGLIALAGAFIYAELSARRPLAGGQYAYLREAYHPLVAFLYGWALLLVIQTGGMAAGAVTFARYVGGLVALPVPEPVIAVTLLAVLTVVNLLGVRAGSSVQSGFMLLKIGAIVAWIVCGLTLVGRGPGIVSGFETIRPPEPPLPPLSFGLAALFGAAMVPVLFSYGGWQTATFVAGEVRDPRRTLPRGLLVGVLGVIALYLAANFVCVRVLGVEGLAMSPKPATDIMLRVLGDPGARFISAGIAISAAGFLSQSMLTAPRVYYAMADDRLFFRRVAWLDPRTRAPVVAIALQGLLAIVIALTGGFEQILSYVVSADWIFFGLTAGAVFALRRHDAASSAGGAEVPKIPGHPFTTLAFVLISAMLVVNTIAHYPANTAIGMGILLAGVPVYFFWSRRAGAGTR
jgi:APA family basic amino acid/polyamine antiporter